MVNGTAGMQKGRKHTGEKIRRRMALNGLRGSKHRQSEEINEKLVTDNPPPSLPPPFFVLISLRDFVGYSNFLSRVFVLVENSLLICWDNFKNNSLFSLPLYFSSN